MLQSETVVENERIRGRTGTGDRRENRGGRSSEKVGKGRIRGGRDYATRLTISQSQKCKRKEAKKKGAGASNARQVERKVCTHVLSPTAT